MFAFDFVEVLPLLIVLPFIGVPVCVGLFSRYGPEGRARELGYRHSHEGKDISDQFVSYEIGAAYRRGQSLYRRDQREMSEYQKQREDKKLLR